MPESTGHALLDLLTLSLVPEGVTTLLLFVPNQTKQLTKLEYNYIFVVLKLGVHTHMCSWLAVYTTKL